MAVALSIIDDVEHEAEPFEPVVSVTVVIDIVPSSPSAYSVDGIHGSAGSLPAVDGAIAKPITCDRSSLAFSFAPLPLLPPPPPHPRTTTATAKVYRRITTPKRRSYSRLRRGGGVWRG